MGVGASALADDNHILPRKRGMGRLSWWNRWVARDVAVSGYRLSVSMFLGLAFLVIAAPVVSRCAALRMPTVRLVKGRRLCSADAVESWKFRIGACETTTSEQGDTDAVVPTRSQEAWWRVLLVLMALSLPTSGIIAVRTFARRWQEILSQQFSAAGNPLRC